MQIYTFRVIIEPDENDTFHGYVPSLPGCHTWGESLEETKRNLREAITCHAQGLLKDNESIPQEHGNLELIEVFSDQEFAADNQNAKVIA